MILLRTYFESLMSSGRKSLSSARFAFLLSVMLSNFLIFGVWVALSIINLKMEIIPESVLVLYALANGITAAGKIVQKKIESSSNPGGLDRTRMGDEMPDPYGGPSINRDGDIMQYGNEPSPYEEMRGKTKEKTKDKSTESNLTFGRRKTK